MTRLGVILFTGLAIALWPGGGVFAQYAPPADTAFVSVNNPTPAVGSTVIVTWRIQGTQGALPPGDGTQQRIFAISLQTPTGAHACVPAIASQPGTDARLTVRNDPADPSTGRADLFTGSTPGAVIVRVACPQGATAQVTVLVQAAGTPTSTALSTPPIAGTTSGTGASSTPRPPSTGFGSQSDGSGPSGVMVAGLLAASALAGAVSIAVLARRRAGRNA